MPFLHALGVSIAVNILIRRIRKRLDELVAIADADYRIASDYRDWDSVTEAEAKLEMAKHMAAEIKKLLPPER